MFALASASHQASAPEVGLYHNISNVNGYATAPDPSGNVADTTDVTRFGVTASLAACSDLCVGWSNASRPGVKCRSFSRYALPYTGNANLSGQCYGHTDSNWLPLPKAGIDSGEVFWDCGTDLDCSLNGKCSSATGKCQCTPQWTGNRCQTMSLEPIDPAKVGFVPRSKDGQNMSAWGGSVWQVNGTWVMWAARMVNHCGINSWQTNSAIVRAEAQDPLGPYTEVGTQAHERVRVCCVGTVPTLRREQGLHSRRKGFNIYHQPCQPTPPHIT